MPMVARDGLHYGANLAMPKAGVYRLTYQSSPPRPAASAATPTRPPASPPGGSRSRSPSTGITRALPGPASSFQPYRGSCEARPRVG